MRRSYRYVYRREIKLFLEQCMVSRIVKHTVDVVIFFEAIRPFYFSQIVRIPLGNALSRNPGKDYG
jgi:hypothetical protein